MMRICRFLNLKVIPGFLPLQQFRLLVLAYCTMIKHGCKNNINNTDDYLIPSECNKC